jgi:hypothetical protein
VVTQHAVPEHRRYDYMVIDEANCLQEKVVKTWLFFARCMKVKYVVCMGDQFQKTIRRKDDGILGDLPLRGKHVRLYNVLGLPLDAFSAFLAVNNVSDVEPFACLNPRVRSLIVTNRLPDPTDFGTFDLATRARVQGCSVKGPRNTDTVSVTQSQGSRAKRHWHAHGLKENGLNWYGKMPSVQTVVLTRHTEELYFDMPASHFLNAFTALALEPIPVINGKSQSRLMQERSRRPFDLDEIRLPGYLTKEMVAGAALPLKFSNTVDDRFVTVNPNPDVSRSDEDRTLPANPCSMKFAVEVINQRTQHVSRREYKEQLDLDASAAHGLISCGEVGFGEECKMRSHIPGVSALGDVQMSRDRYHDLRNMLLRQLNEKKRLSITVQDVSDAKEILDNYIKTFVKRHFQVQAVESFNYDYLKSRTSQFIESWNNPLGDSAQTLARSSFLKTQVKVKPGLNGQETHGQTVIANTPEFTNEFGPYTRMGYYAMAATERDDFLTDAGFSDEELSALMRERGIAERIEASGNMAIDLTRQDSTHRPAHVIAYCMYLEVFAGVPKDVCESYLKYRSLAYVKSMAEHLYKAQISWNLGSGDPFTLNANCFMMKSSVATRYEGLDKCAGLQKGDDFLCSREGYYLSPKGALYARLGVTMKIDINKPPYHAGRFLFEGNLLADPVRAFFRHFAKPHDPATTLEALWVSFVDRKVHYTERQATYLKLVVPEFYEEVSYEEAVYIVDALLAIRCFKVFKSTYKYSNRYEHDIYSPTTDCAFQVARALKPHLSISVLRQFRNQQDPQKLIALYGKYGIDAVRASHPCFVPDGFVGAVVSSVHAYALLERTPATM